MTRTSSYVTATIPALVVLGFFVWFANWIPKHGGSRRQCERSPRI